MSTFVIQSPDEARALPASVRTRRGGRAAVVVEIPGLEASERRRWGDRLGYWANACGCHTGAFFTLAAIVACVVSPPGDFGTLPTRVLASTGVVLAAAITGKVVGLLVARVMLRIDLNRLIRHTSTHAVATTER